jgi:hypothetical protein
MWRLPSGVFGTPSAPYGDLKAQKRGLWAI